MTTKQIVDEMEKKFDEKFPNKIAEVVDDFNSPVKNNIKSFLRSHIRTLLENFGEEIIGRDEVRQVRIKDDCYKSGYKTKSIGSAYMRNKLRAEQRLKVKEILQNI